MGAFSRGGARTAQLPGRGSRHQEPWDGPAALIFTDGITVGAKLDRNGLRPLRYTLTSDGLLVVGSEVGIADLNGKEIVERQRLGPGEILLVNPVSGEFVRPKDSLRLRDGIRPVSSRPTALIAPTEERIWRCDSRAEANHGRDGLERRSISGFCSSPWSNKGRKRSGAWATTRRRLRCRAFRRPLWDYCKQRFAQVTNPPIDSLRETT